MTQACLALAALLLAAPASFPRPALDPGQRAAAVLAFAPAPGTVLTYDFTCLVSSSAVSFGGRELPFQAVSRGVLRMAVGSSRDGLTDVRLSSPGIEVSYNAGGRSDKYSLFVSDESPVRLTLSRGGRIVATRNGEALEKRNRVDVPVLDMIGFCFPSLPDASRRIGETWTDKRRLTFPFQGMKIGVDLVLPFLVRDLGTGIAPVASLTAEPVITLSGKGSLSDLSMAVEGTGSGHLDLRYAVAGSVIEDYRLQAQVQGSMVSRSEGATVFQFPLRLTLTVFLARRPDSPTPL
jgi:hypothetical protein